MFGDIFICQFPFTSGAASKIRPALVLFDLEQDAIIGSERIGVVPVAARRAEQFAADFPGSPLRLATVAGRLPAPDSGGKDDSTNRGIVAANVGWR